MSTLDTLMLIISMLRRYTRKSKIFKLYKALIILGAAYGLVKGFQDSL